MADTLVRRFAGWHWAKRGLLLAVMGAIAGLGHAPVDWPILTVLALAVFLAFHRGVPDTRTAAWQGWAFGVGYFAVTLRWIVSPFLVHIETDGWMAPFALIFMAGGAALFWALAGGLAQRLRPNSMTLLAIALVLVEAARGLILTGFPWGLLGHVLIDTQFAHLAAYLGPHALTALVCLAALGLAKAATGALRDGAIIVLLVAGLWPVLAPTYRAAPDDAPMVRLIQPNAPQEQKWDPAFSGIFFDRQLEYTGAGDAPDLIVWPESAIADLLNYATPYFEQMSDAARGAPVIVGMNRRDENLYYNSFVLLGRGGLIDTLYDKQHLVPLGEYFPGGELLASVTGVTQFASSHGGGFSDGATARTMQIPGIGLIRPLICYEGIFAEEITTDVRPRAMVLITNDAWFGKDAGPYQHLAQARLRAIEQGMPMVRVANTGVSAMIDGHGRITGQIALNTAGYLDVPLPDLLDATVYTRFGDIPLLTVMVLLGAGLALQRPRKTS
ncbi:apolipoprotein N-acyltransferase [Yoonia sp. 208BN28-4]|uniref:apolipoprotein N-acyltransferase n=1 Tax=Yoonia sp. 208BN28-4 TaxID=3126505 RepID=UPI0030A2192F